MIKIARRFLNLLFTLGVYKKHFKLTYDGDLISWNKLYSQGHWAVRSGLKNKHQEIFSLLLLEARMKQVSEMAIVVFYNNKMDVDNISLTTKWLADTIKGTYIADDSNKYYKGLMIFHDPSLPKKRTEIHIVGNAN